MVRFYVEAQSTSRPIGRVNGFKTHSVKVRIFFGGHSVYGANGRHNGFKPRTITGSSPVIPTMRVYFNGRMGSLYLSNGGSIPSTRTFLD